MRGGVIEVPQGGAVVSDEHLLGGRRLLDLEHPLFGLRRLRLGIFGGDDGAGDGPISVAEPRQRVLLANVPHDDHRRVVGGVVRSIEIFAIGGGEPLDVGHPADGRPVVGVAREGRLVQELVGRPFDVVVDAEAAFVGHHLFFARDLRFAEDEMGHAIALQPHRQREAVLGEGFVIVGPVDPGRGVGFGAALFELPIELPGLQRFGLVEHEVLEEMGEPRLPRPLVTGTHVVPGEVADHGGALVHQDENPEPVL